jgi:GT2 family glycosyltransferase
MGDVGPNDGIQISCAAAPRVSIIIPAFSTFELLTACLRSLAAHAPPEVASETIIVLNEATDDAVERLAEMVTGTKIIPSPVNLGLTGAGNRGRHEALGELIVLLHDDAEVRPGWLEALLEAAEAYPEAGAIGSKVLWPDGQLQDAGCILWRDASTSACWVGAAPSPDSFDKIRAVDYCGTSSLLIRASVWDAIGGLDERLYPTYYVDVNIAMEVRRMGGVVLYQPKSRIVHHRGASGTPRYRAFLGHRNRQTFTRKWGHQLEEHEPRTDDTAEAVSRAMRRADERRLRVSPSWPSSSQAFAGQDRILPEPEHYLKKAYEVQTEYVSYLNSLLDQPPGPIPTYTFGQRVTFDRSGPGHQYTAAGSLHAAETWGSWIAVSPCEILLPIKKDDTGSQYQVEASLVLEIETTHFICSARNESPMRIAVDDVDVLNLIITTDGVHTHCIPLPSARLKQSNYLNICIKTDNAMSPAESQINSDLRKLSVGLVSLMVRKAAARL